MENKRKEPGNKVVSITYIFLLLFSLLDFGCRNCDLVEAELRSRENQLREMHGALVQSEAVRDALQHEQHMGPPNLSSKSDSESALSLYFVKEIVLGRLTGGYDEDDLSGDVALQVFLEPHDRDGRIVKAPGIIHVTALEVSSEGRKRLLSTWDYGPEQVQRAWRQGLLGTGYFIVMPWKIWPSTPRLHVVVQLVLTDGRTFEAEKDVTVRLVPPGKRKGASGDAPSRVPPIPPDPETLPTPRGVESGPWLGLKAKTTSPFGPTSACPAMLLRPVPRR